MTNILITGGRGQLGRALQVALVGHEVTPLDHEQMDVTNREVVFATFNEARPQVVIHCAAYTDVDGCARNPELAYRINALGTQNVALACRAADAVMVHVSTNEVFAGDRPGGYEEWMAVNPINAYGRSKAAAEIHVQGLLHRYYLVRTAWLYAADGRNFIHTILERARQNGEVRVVTDEIGNPTYCQDLAEAIGRLIETEQYGVYHLVNEGACSRWAFANEILRLAGLDSTHNVPILSRDYPRASTPPLQAALLNRAGAAVGLRLRPWQEALAEYLTHYPH